MASFSGPATSSLETNVSPCPPREAKGDGRERSTGTTLAFIFRCPRPPKSPPTPVKGPGAAHLPARRQRTAGGGQVPSPGRLAAGERPAANPGGAPARREPAAGSARRPPPAPPACQPRAEEQHLLPAAVGRRQAGGLPAWARSRSGLAGLRARLAARSPPAGPPADSSAALPSRAGGAGAPVTPEGGTAGAGAGRGGRRAGGAGGGCGSALPAPKRQGGRVAAWSLLTPLSPAPQEGRSRREAGVKCRTLGHCFPAAGL